jgi:hypothetical protein
MRGARRAWMTLAGGWLTGCACRRDRGAERSLTIQGEVDEIRDILMGKLEKSSPDVRWGMRRGRWAHDLPRRQLQGPARGEVPLPVRSGRVPPFAAGA